MGVVSVGVVRRVCTVWRILRFGLPANQQPREAFATREEAGVRLMGGWLTSRESCPRSSRREPPSASTTHAAAADFASRLMRSERGASPGGVTPMLSRA
jgi:hypothetical protein